MTSSRPTPDEDPLDPTDPETADLLRQLAGEPPAGETRATFALEDVAEVDEGLTGTELERGYLEAGVDPSGGVRSEDILSVDAIVERELEADETFDPDIAAEEGIPWVPPTDPVVVPDEHDPEGLRVAGGIGISALDEPFDADHHSTLLPDEDEVTARVREALRADAATTAYAEQLTIDTEGDVVTLRGTVADIEDLDAVLAVAAEVTGINEVVDELDVEGL